MEDERYKNIHHSYTLLHRNERSIIDEIIGFLANDHKIDAKIYDKITVFDSMQKEFDYLKKRYDSKLFKDHQTTLKDVQPYYLWRHN